MNLHIPTDSQVNVLILVATKQNTLILKKGVLKPVKLLNAHSIFCFVTLFR